MVYHQCHGLTLFLELSQITCMGYLWVLPRQLSVSGSLLPKVNNHFFIGNHLHSISKRLTGIKPSNYIERLPRNLEKHFAHLKATELQAWLLYYAIPCLLGYLSAKYLQHFACLSEGIHLLLGDNITEGDLHVVRAETLLNIFYKDFSSLYGEGSCGINVDNVGVHLAFYVRLWGPLFAWSCFGFEDWNTALLQAVHGTGDVTRQILCHVNAQLQLKGLLLPMPDGPSKGYLKLLKPSRQWKVTKDCQGLYHLWSNS